MGCTTKETHVHVCMHPCLTFQTVWTILDFYFRWKYCVESVCCNRAKVIWHKTTAILFAHVNENTSTRMPVILTCMLRCGTRTLTCWCPCYSHHPTHDSVCLRGVCAAASWFCFNIWYYMPSLLNAQNLCCRLHCIPKFASLSRLKGYLTTWTSLFLCCVVPSWLQKGSYSSSLTPRMRVSWIRVDSRFAGIGKAIHSWCAVLPCLRPWRILMWPFEIAQHRWAWEQMYV